MRKINFFITLLLIPIVISAQIDTYENEDTPPGGIAREELPLAVVWSLSAYSGLTAPCAPDAFADFWRPAPHITVDMDLLLRNDAILGLSFSYTKLQFDEQEFWSFRGVDAEGDLGDDFNIPITNLLLSFRGFEHYMLYQYTPTYELGGGIYHLKNTQLDLTYIDPYGSYVLSKADRINFGLFAGLGLKYLVTDTFQFIIKGRFHHVFKPAQNHQFFDVLVGVSIL